MRPGEGAGYLLADIAAGKTRSQIREKWLAGDYGDKSERPRGDYVDGWLKLANR
jgi:hypothetical protein